MIQPFRQVVHPFRLEALEQILRGVWSIACILNCHRRNGRGDQQEDCCKGVSYNCR